MLFNKNDYSDKRWAMYLGVGGGKLCRTRKEEKKNILTVKTRLFSLTIYESSLRFFHFRCVLYGFKGIGRIELSKREHLQDNRSVDSLKKGKVLF